MKQYIIIDEHGKSYFSDKEMSVLHREDGPALEKVDGSMHWYNNGLLHRTDGPAVYIPYEYFNHGKLTKSPITKWYIDGKLHRLDGPAVIHPNVDMWYNNGLLHRTDGPAMYIPYEYFENGKLTKKITKWYIDGKLHRSDGPAVIQPNGDQAWYNNGLLHRTDGPALVKRVNLFKEPYFKSWYINGRLHREDGPAIERESGGDLWYINDKLVTKQEHYDFYHPQKKLTININGKEFTVEELNTLIETAKGNS